MASVGLLIFADVALYHLLVVYLSVLALVDTSGASDLGLLTPPAVPVWCRSGRWLYVLV
ncbi:phage tail protein [Escherichia coli]|uniref:phage tail protein n=1 Tax=Escherichia coli TaxID=562 RepID=UPI00111DCF35|nr:phage tail protein [Escherichia coli]